MYEEMEVSIGDTVNVTEEIIDTEERLADRVVCLEEEVAGLKERNNELTIHLNTAIQELNAVIYILNKENGIEVNTVNID